MKISISAPKGTVPRTSPLLIQKDYAQVADNCDLHRGEIRPLKRPLLATTLTLMGAFIKSVYLWRVGTGGDDYWLRFKDDVDIIRSPIADDAYSRIYWSGDSRMDDAVLYSYTPAIYTGGSEYPANYFKLGIPAPTNPPTAVIDGTPPENTSDEARFYVFTYVGKLGEEGPPSPVSERLIVASEGASVVLTNLVVDLSASTGREIVAIRIYRTLSGSYGSAFQFVAQVGITGAAYTDTKNGTELAEPIVSETWDPPRVGMQGLGITQQGVAFGFLGKIICFSELYKPYAWPRDYELTAFDDVVAIGYYDAHFIVATNGRPVMITGIDPATLSQQELPIIEACVSKRSMVSLGYSAIYASPNGLVMAAGSSAQLVTNSLFTKEEWEKLNPSSIHAYEHRGMYLFFWKVSDTEKGGFMFDPKNVSDGILSTDQWFSSGSRDLATDTLYLVGDDGEVFAWDSGAPLPFRWRSKRFRMSKPVQYTVGRVTADDYDDLTFRVYADGELRHEQSVTGPGAFRLPREGKVKQWELEVSGTSAVQEIVVAESMTELQE